MCSSGTRTNDNVISIKSIMCHTLPHDVARKQLLHQPWSQQNYPKRLNKLKLTCIPTNEYQTIQTWIRHVSNPSLSHWSLSARSVFCFVGSRSTWGGAPGWIRFHILRESLKSSDLKLFWTGGVAGRPENTHTHTHTHTHHTHIFIIYLSIAEHLLGVVFPDFQPHVYAFKVRWHWHNSDILWQCSEGSAVKILKKWEINLASKKNGCEDSIGIFRIFENFRGPIEDYKWNLVGPVYLLQIFVVPQLVDCSPSNCPLCLSRSPWKGILVFSQVELRSCFTFPSLWFFGSFVRLQLYLLIFFNHAN